MRPEAAGDQPPTSEDLAWARHGFINSVYPKLFAKNNLPDISAAWRNIGQTDLLKGL